MGGSPEWAMGDRLAMTPPLQAVHRDGEGLGRRSRFSHLPRVIWELKAGGKPLYLVGSASQKLAWTCPIFGNEPLEKRGILFSVHLEVGM